jgi:hypothetical protein
MAILTTTSSLDGAIGAIKMAPIATTIDANGDWVHQCPMASLNSNASGTIQPPFVGIMSDSI